MRFAVRGVVAVALAAGALNMVGLGSAAVVAAAATTTRVSVSTKGIQGNADSTAVAISAGGRFVLFDSLASNLVLGDRNADRDVFLRNLRSGRTVRVSVGPGGREANGASRGAAVSPDGRFVVFRSNATNLTSTPDGNGGWNVFLRDRARGTTSRVSVPPSGGQFGRTNRYGVTVAGMSDNGRYIAYSFATLDEQPIYLRDRLLRVTHVVGGTRGWWFDPFGLSATGQWLVYGSEFNGGGTAVTDLYLRNLWTNRTTRIPDQQSHQFSGVVVSRDGHYVGFDDLDDQADGTDTFRWNRVTGRVVDVRTGATPAGISTSGRYVVVVTNSWAIPASAHMFRIDLATHTVQRVDIATNGDPVPQGVVQRQSLPLALLSADGRSALFTSRDSTIVPDDTNHSTDVFVRRQLT